MQFSTTLKSLMEARHVDADKLAERVHVEVETVHAWLQGTEMPDMEMLVHISETLNVTTDRLLNADTKTQREHEIDPTTGLSYQAIEVNFIVFGLALGLLIYFLTRQWEFAIIAPLSFLGLGFLSTSHLKKKAKRNTKDS